MTPVIRFSWSCTKGTSLVFTPSKSAVILAGIFASVSKPCPFSIHATAQTLASMSQPRFGQSKSIFWTGTPVADKARQNSQQGTRMHAYHMHIHTKTPIINGAAETWLELCVKGLADLFMLARPTAWRSMHWYQENKKMISLNSLEEEVILEAQINCLSHLLL